MPGERRDHRPRTEHSHHQSGAASRPHRERDTATLKGDFARNRTIQDAQNIAHDLDLEFVRVLSSKELREMAGNSLPKDVGRSFRNADLVIEATTGPTGPTLAT